jgi:ATP-binding cassette subfamily F protein uup
VGGYNDWLRQGRALAETENPAGAANRSSAARAAGSTLKPKKLGFNERRELDTLPGRIEALESKLAELQSRIADPQFYAQEHDEIKPVLEQLDTVQREIERALHRWTQLEDLQQAYVSARNAD